MQLTSSGEQIFALRGGEGTIARECVLGHRRLSLSPPAALLFLGPPQSSTTEPEPRSSGGTGSTDTAFSTKEMSQRLPKAFDKHFFFFFNSFRRICFLQVQTRVARKSEQTRFLHLSFSSLETFLPLQAD